MNARIEEALVAWLSSLGGITVPVHPGASSDDIDPERLAIIVAVSEITHVIGDLHTATVEFIIMGPARHADLATYRALAPAIRSMIDAHTANDLAGTFTLYTGTGFSGLWVRESAERFEGNRWMHTLRVIMGYQ